MKILLINNYQQDNETATFEALKASLIGYEVEIQRYHPGIEFADYGKDLVILSGGGGEGSEINDKYAQDKLWYGDQIDYVLSSGKPILGICMGFEVIASAYGSKVTEMKEYLSGFKRVSLNPKGRGVLNKKELLQYENHKWRVTDVPSSRFEVLAQSETGIEAFKHKTKKIFGVQFHPEKGGTIELADTLPALINP